MLSIQAPKSTSTSQNDAPPRTTPNLLPMRINHNGRVNDTQRYWKPETDDKGKQHVYFRGRHFHGTTLALPEQYTGAVLSVTERRVPASQTRSQAQKSHQTTDLAENNEEEEEEGEDVRIAEQIGAFDEIIVWGHGGEVDGARDMFVRGVGEWVGFAESMHCEGEGDE